MIEFYQEHEISEADNAKLMELLRICFPKLEQFKERRFYLEAPHFRWLIREGERIVANVAVHDKTFLAGDDKIRIAGVACVGVHPDFRRRGYVKQMLAEAHAWCRDQNFPFAFLFGNDEIYRSSGYVQCENEFKYLNHKKNVEETSQLQAARYAPLADQPWPNTPIDLQGPRF